MLAALLSLLPVGASAAAVSSLASSSSGSSTAFLGTSLTSCANEQFTYSCENSTAIKNTCCSPTPGGLQLATVFWDTYTGLESKGQYLPKDTWTIHGLWPDNCDGSYDSYCDLSRQYDPLPSPNKTSNGTVIKPYTGPSIAKYLKEYNRKDLLDYMKTYWVAQGQPSPDFWAHEFSKHATCTSTFDKSCYPNYKEGMDVVDFFQAVVRAYQQYPHFEILSAFGIVPSNSTTYTLSQLQNAYKSQIGALPYFGCSKDSQGNKTVLSEIWVNAHVLGTPQYGQFKAVDTPAKSSCADSNIHYFERAPGSEKEPTIY